MLHIWKFLREQILKIIIIGKKLSGYMVASVD